MDVTLSPETTDTPPPLRASGEVVVSVRNLCRSFNQVQAVRGISFDIRKGQVVGFIGANGAGKTTTMRMLATLDEPDSGSIVINGHDLRDDPASVRRFVGWMPDAYGAYDNMTVLEYLDFQGRACGLARGVRRSRIDEIVTFADLAPIADRPVNRLSKGQGQRVCFGRMLLHDPEFLLLDEPAAGLDPKARIEFKNLVRILAARGKTLFISSHILSELDEMCDSLLFIDGGRLVHHGSAQTLRTGSADGSAVFIVQLASDTSGRLDEWVAMNPGWSMVERLRDGARLRHETGESSLIAASLRRMVQDGLPVIEFHREQRRLEEAFVEMISGPRR